MLHIIATLTILFQIIKIVPGDSNFKRLQPRIVGGEDAPRNTYPFVAALKLVSPMPQKDYFGCGGTIIHKRWILTAGHCLITKKFAVVVGSTLWNTREVSLTYNVARTIRHPLYKNVTEDYDLGLVKLSHDLDFSNPNIAPIKFGQIGNKKSVISLGWGFEHAAYVAPIPDQLKIINLTTDYTCNPKATPSRRRFFNVLRICTKGGPDFGTCSGDSGGPLINPETSELVGVVSGGLGECASGAADIFTRVWPYRFWIWRSIDKFT